VAESKKGKGWLKEEIKQTWQAQKEALTRRKFLVQGNQTETWKNV